MEDLSFEAQDGRGGGPADLRLCVRPAVPGAGAAPVGRLVFDLDGFQGSQAGDEFRLSDGASSMALRPALGQIEVRLHESFFGKPEALQRNFWAFGLMKLLRARGAFTLHAAGLVSPRGQGLLLVAEPGSGKSTLAIGLVARGWNYVSDDAVLLVEDSGGVSALALRRHFYVDAAARGRYRHVSPVATPDAGGGLRHRLDIDRAWPGRRSELCRPKFLVWPRIADGPESRLEPLDDAQAMALLLRESGPQLFDRETMDAHLSALRALIAQCQCFRLHSGRDLLDDPGGLEDRLSTVAE